MAKILGLQLPSDWTPQRDGWQYFKVSKGVTVTVKGTKDSISSISVDCKRIMAKFSQDSETVRQFTALMSSSSVASPWDERQTIAALDSQISFPQNQGGYALQASPQSQLFIIKLSWVI